MESHLVPRHPVRLVSQRTGLSGHVLRAWERRYRAVAPVRSAGGQRLYSDGDIERLILLKRLSEAGHRLQSVAGLSATELRRLLPTPGGTADAFGDAAVDPSGDGIAEVRRVALGQIGRMDQAGLQSTLRRAAAGYGLWTFVTGIAVPVMREVGDRWHDGSLGVAHEHLATVVVRMAFAGVREDATPPAPDAPGIVAGTVAGERHELGALLVAAVAALEGWRVTYLGPDVPDQDLAAAASATGASIVALSATVADPDGPDATTYRRLSEMLPAETMLVVGGPAAPSDRGRVAGRRFRTLPSLEAFRALLRAEHLERA